MRWILQAMVSLALIGVGLAQLKSPDGRYEVAYTSAGEYEANVEFKDTRSGKVIHQSSSSGYQELKYREVVWSKDSKYLALISRGTRTTTELEILHFDDGVVTEVKLPNYGAELQKQKPSAKGGRYEWISKLRWENHKLTFRCAGQWQDGSGDPAVDPDNWYHFKVTLEPNAKDDPGQACLVGLKVLKEPVKFE